MKKVVVAALGGILTLGGIALLVLPGPGFVLIAAGLAVLATQFEWARKPLEDAKKKAKQGMDEVGRSCGLALLAIGVVELTPINLPFVTPISAVLLILSGIGLLGTVVYARTQRDQSGSQ